MKRGINRGISIGSDDVLIKLLVAWYGLYQSIHIIVNTRGLVQLIHGSIDFPAPPPSGGWASQVIHFFTAMAALDLFNAILTLIFVFGFFKKTHWRFWLGIITLTISIYSALLFNYATFTSGAWTENNIISYLFINITFLPVIALFVLILTQKIKQGQIKN